MVGKVFYHTPRYKSGLSIVEIVKKKEVKGEIGLEIEVEGNKFPKTENHSPQGVNVGIELIPKQWSYYHDGSLRGQDNAEYVLTKPLMFKDIPKAVDDLWEMFTKFGSVLDESNRTSVHVHLNVQKFHLNRLCSFLALYFSIEELLTAWCGDHRVGNMFCLRAKDAPGIISKIKVFLRGEGFGHFTEGLHYSGLNVYSLLKFGSLEFRTLRGVTNPVTILDWVAILERLYKLSEEFPDPRAVCENFSGTGPLAYLEMVLGDKVGIVRSGIDYDNQQVMSSIYDGIRLAQDLCYCRDWSQYKPVKVAKDPFRRSTSAILDSISSTGEAAPSQLPLVQGLTTEGWLPDAYPGTATTTDWPMAYLTSTPHEEGEQEDDVDIDDLFDDDDDDEYTDEQEEGPNF